MIDVHENFARRKRQCCEPGSRMRHENARFGEFFIAGAMRFYGGGSSSSTTSPTTTNEETALETGGAPGVAVGAGGSTGAINITSGDVATSQAAINAAAAAVASVVGLASDESHTEAGVIEHEGDTVGEVSTGAIAANTQISGAVVNAASTLGTNALAVGQNLGLASLQFAQNETTLNLNALNTNTALAFATINNLTAAQAAGQISSAASELQAATTAAGATTATPTVIYAGSTQQPLTSGTSTNGNKMSTGAWIALAAVAVVGIYLFTRKK